MLVFSRKAGEGFTIGDNIRISVTEISKDKVRIGIEAPRDVKIMRNELKETKDFNVRAAAAKLPADLVSRITSGLSDSNSGGKE